MNEKDYTTKIKGYKVTVKLEDGEFIELSISFFRADNKDPFYSPTLDVDCRYFADIATELTAMGKITVAQLDDYMKSK